MLVLLWLGLAAGPSVMLMATTNQICQEVAVVPFLWILPLTLYLLSFIICFDSPRWYDRRFFLPLLVCAVFASAIMLYVGVGAPLLAQIGLYSLTLFACAMVCHGELVRARPPARDLTLFYLCVASGGAVGGIFVALAAPMIFSGFWEYHLALVACPALAVAALVRDPGTALHRGRPLWLPAVLFLAFAVLVAGLVIHVRHFSQGVVAASRNFYGVVRVRDVYDYDAKATCAGSSTERSGMARSSWTRKNAAGPSATTTHSPESVWQSSSTHAAGRPIRTRRGCASASWGWGPAPSPPWRRPATRSPSTTSTPT